MYLLILLQILLIIVILFKSKNIELNNKIRHENSLQIYLLLPKFEVKCVGSEVGYFIFEL